MDEITIKGGKASVTTPDGKTASIFDRPTEAFKPLEAKDNVIGFKLEAGGAEMLQVK